MANPSSGVQPSAENNNQNKNDADSETDDDDDDEVIETSPCGRWEKHKKELTQRNAPGIDRTFLAMDTEEGVEVVWNEVRFSERKSWKNKEEVFKRIFENLTQLDHPNIVKFHKYWVDLKGDHPRLIFIAEYMTSGSLRLFLKKTKPNIKSFNVKGWKRWCKQILSALRYLHSCDPPIVHGNLNCDTIFIQHNGLMKIGTVAPDAIHNYVKTYKHQKRNMHFIAPEYDGESLFTALSAEENSCSKELGLFNIQRENKQSSPQPPHQHQQQQQALQQQQQKQQQQQQQQQQQKKQPSTAQQNHQAQPPPQPPPQTQPLSQHQPSPQQPSSLTSSQQLKLQPQPQQQSQPKQSQQQQPKQQQQNISRPVVFTSVSGRMVNCAADIYSFGMVALEMATLQWPEGTNSVTPEIIDSAIEGLEDQNQKDFIRKCIEKDPAKRPSIRNLLLQPIMLEVNPLKILAGHALVDSDLAAQRIGSRDFWRVSESVLKRVKNIEQMEERDSDRVMAEVHMNNKEKKEWKFSKVQPLELEKFLEEIKTGLYPLTGMERTKAKKENRPQLNASRPKSPEDIANSSQGNEDEEKEVRLIIQMSCTVKTLEDGSGKTLSLLLRLDDKMNRQLSCKVQENETAIDLANELVRYGLVNELDRDKVASKIDEHLQAPS